MIRIGYPCMNTSAGCTTAGTLRLAGYSDEKAREKIASNLACLKKIFAYNLEHDIQVYRVSSNLIPYASHPVMTIAWQKEFRATFAQLGEMVTRGKMRLSTHPGQFVLINAPTPSIVEKSIRELAYQVDMLELLGTDTTHKVQIHVGGIYGDKEASLQRFIQNAALLPQRVRERLIIENDERLYSVEDCIKISESTRLPVLFDEFHHSINPGSLSPQNAFTATRKTWKAHDGVQQIDYSQQDPQKQPGAHSQSIDPVPFADFLAKIGYPEPLDVMLEVKDKEQSVQAVRSYLKTNNY